MVRAYVLILTGVGRAPEVAASLAKRKGARSAEQTVGPYDVIAQVEASDLDHLAASVLRDIQGQAGVERTMTCVVVEPGPAAAPGPSRTGAVSRSTRVRTAP